MEGKGVGGGRHLKYSRFFESYKGFEGNLSPLRPTAQGPKTVFMAVGQNKEIQNSPGRTSRGF